MIEGDQLPAGWATSSLAELASSMGGGTPPTTDASYWDDGSTPWVSPKDMKSFRLRGTIDRVTDKALKRLAIVPQGSVLVVVRSGILSRALPVAINDAPVVLNQDMRAFIPKAGIDASFLAWQLVAQTSLILETCTKDGTTVASIEAPRLAAFPIPLAPEREQRRIVAAIEELLANLDDGIDELRAGKRKLTLYRQTLLKSAVEGRLTADWRRNNPPRETGGELLARILSERRARWEARQLARFVASGKAPPGDWRAKFTPPSAARSTGGPVPESWSTSTIGACFTVAVGATPSRKVPAFWGGNVPWVSSGEVRFNRVSTTRETISQAGLGGSSTQINPVGSVLLGMIGEGRTRGQVAILDTPAANNQNCAAIWVSETDVPPEFVYYWLWSRYDETRRGSSGNNQPALNKSLVEAMPLPLPPVDEAREIVRAVSEQMDAVTRLEREIEHQYRVTTAQRQNILRAAFSGRLVAQDPDDEPASVLLQRIRAVRLHGEARASSELARRRRDNQPHAERRKHEPSIPS